MIESATAHHGYRQMPVMIAFQNKVDVEIAKLELKWHEVAVPVEYLTSRF